MIIAPLIAITGSKRGKIEGGVCMTFEQALEIYYINVEIKSIRLELDEHKENRKYYRTVILTDSTKARGEHTNPTDKWLIKEQQLTDMLRYSLDQLQQKTIEFEKFLKAVEDAETRVILRLRCINNMSWEEIGDNLGMDRRTASRKFNRFFNISGK